MHGYKVAALNPRTIPRWLPCTDLPCRDTNLYAYARMIEMNIFLNPIPLLHAFPSQPERYCDEQRPDLRMATNITPTRTVLELTLVKSDCQENGQ